MTEYRVLRYFRRHTLVKLIAHRPYHIGSAYILPTWATLLSATVIGPRTQGVKDSGTCCALTLWNLPARPFGKGKFNYLRRTVPGISGDSAPVDGRRGLNGDAICAGNTAPSQAWRQGIFVLNLGPDHFYFGGFLALLCQAATAAVIPGSVAKARYRE